jgi:hypothetical protein
VRSVIILALLSLAGCSTQVDEATFETIPTPEASTPVATAVAPSPTAEVSTDGSVSVTFRLTLSGPVPDDAVFALQTGIVGGGEGANYLCSYYGGYPACAAGETYEETYEFAPGTRVSYQFWRELDVNGTSEELEAGEVTVGPIDQGISVSYAFQP